MSAATRIADLQARGAEHGTRSRYVLGCRCDACRAANTAHARERQRAIVEAAPTVTPSGPPIEGTIERGGRTHRILRCPGAEGASCVAEPATWLRGKDVCRACVARATVWDGLVDPKRARKHLRKLSRRGVGAHAVADASDVPRTTLRRILDEDGAIRASTERRILAVDEGARADGAAVDAKRPNARLAGLRARGFTLRQLGELLGCNGLAQYGGRARMRASTALRIERLWRRVERGEVQPERAFVDAAPERAWLAEMLERGMPAWYLAERLGFVVRGRERGYMRPEHVLAVRALRDEIEGLTVAELGRVIAALRRDRRRG